MPVAGDDLADGKALLGIAGSPAPESCRSASCRSVCATAPSRRRSRGPTSSRARLWGFRSVPCRRRFRGVAFNGERPLAFRPYSFCVLASQTMANRSPPMPQRHRLHQAHRGIGGDGRVDGVAALPQDVEADLGRQWLAGRHHAVRCDGDRTAYLIRRRRIAFGPSLRRLRSSMWSCTSSPEVLGTSHSLIGTGYYPFRQRQVRP